MNFAERKVREYIQHYNPRKYWKLRERCVNASNQYPRWLKVIWLLYIKRCDAFNNASLGTFLNHGATFAEPPNFPHGLYGIIVSQNAVIGRNATIFHQVTIGNGGGGGTCYRR